MGGKRALVALGFCLFTCASCASEPPKVVSPPPPPEPAAPAASYTYAPPTGPLEDSKKALAAAAGEKDPHERCRLLNEAALLDPSSLEARRARAESRCAAAVELLADAKFVFGSGKDVDTARVLRDVAVRAEDTAALRDAAAAFVELKDYYDAAAAFVTLDDHVAAAAAFDGLAENRASKGAAVDALDAKLSAIIERARSKTAVLAQLDALLDEAAEAKKSYGAAWVGPKYLEALAAARNGGEDTAALALKAQKRGLFAGAELWFEIERGIASARAGKEPSALLARVRTSPLDAPTRALFAVALKDCGARLGHARAHAALPEAPLRLDDDVAWARGKCAGTAARPSLVSPRDPPDVADAKGIVDPPAKRLRTLAIVKKRPDDVAAAAWAALVADYFPPAPLNADPAVQEALWMRSLAAAAGKPSITRAKAYVDALKTSVEADLPRALAAPVALLLEQARLMTVDSKHGWEEIAAVVVQDCGVGLAGACLPTEGARLSHATDLVRSPRPFVLATYGPKFSKDDFADARVRLDVIVALITWQKNVKAAIKLRGPDYGPFPLPEGALASAMIAANAGNCSAAKTIAKDAAPLTQAYADAFAHLSKTCP